MRRLVKAILAAVFYILIFMVVPLMVQSFIPAEITGGMEKMMGIKMERYIYFLMGVGGLLAALAFFKHLTKKGSLFNLSTAIASLLVWFGLSLFLLGLGDIWGFGITEKQIEMEGGSYTIFLNFSLVVMVLGIATGLGILKEGLRFWLARREGIKD